MSYDNLPDLKLSMEPKRHIKSKKKRIRKKYISKDFWLSMKSAHTKLMQLYDELDNKED